MWKISIGSLGLLAILVWAQIKDTGNHPEITHNRLVLMIIMGAMFLISTLYWIYEINQGGKRPNKVE